MTIIHSVPSWHQAGNAVLALLARRFLIQGLAGGRAVALQPSAPAPAPAPPPPPPPLPGAPSWRGHCLRPSRPRPPPPAAARLRAASRACRRRCGSRLVERSIALPRCSCPSWGARRRRPCPMDFPASVLPAAVASPRRSNEPLTTTAAPCARLRWSLATRGLSSRDGFHPRKIRSAKRCSKQATKDLCFLVLEPSAFLTPWERPCATPSETPWGE